MMRLAATAIAVFLSFSVFSIKSISLLADSQHTQNSISRLAFADFSLLLSQACNCDVFWNEPTAEIIIKLPEIDTTEVKRPSRFEKNTTYPYLRYPEHDYRWVSKKEGGQIILNLETKSFQGISFGLYGLLQERLGFLFYHPKESIIPSIEKWPLPEDFEWDAKARFDKKGFHLHTQHPIELTEYLLDETRENALQEVKVYINWLTRNQQNYFEFCLLESINMKTWGAFAKQMVDYGHSRGIIMGVDLSLHMIQQKAFQLYRVPPVSFKSKKKQISNALELLFEADWDVLNVEFSTTEFTGGNVKKKEKMRLYLTDKVTNEYGAKLMGRKHVVKEEQELGRKKKHYEMDSLETTLDKQRGILIHTVMFYTMFEKKAPVYENENLRHMLNALLKEMHVRETWYYPESAYWVTFDNSVPMFLLPYLQARLGDILLSDSLDVKGHITFSSGWEWGYWLIDWSIARWSWQHNFNGKEQPVSACMFLDNIFETEKITESFGHLLDLQQKYLKDKELMRYMTAANPTDELPGPLNIEFHPRPKRSYKWMHKKADLQAIKIIKKDAEQLVGFAEKSTEILAELNHEKLRLTAEQEKLFAELVDAIQITVLRAMHKTVTLGSLLSKRENKITKNTTFNPASFLGEAEALRKKAQQIVYKREQQYRYSVDLIARKRWGHTAYRFGYLYPVSNLHFWQREEQQALKGRFGPLFMNIWNMPRIIGIVN